MQPEDHANPDPVANGRMVVRYGAVATVEGTGNTIGRSEGAEDIRVEGTSVVEGAGSELLIEKGCIGVGRDEGTAATLVVRDGAFFNSVNITAGRGGTEGTGGEGRTRLCRPH